MAARDPPVGRIQPVRGSAPIDQNQKDHFGLYMIIAGMCTSGRCRGALTWRRSRFSAQLPAAACARVGRPEESHRPETRLATEVTMIATAQLQVPLRVTSEVPHGEPVQASHGSPIRQLLLA